MNNKESYSAWTIECTFHLIIWILMFIVVGTYGGRTINKVLHKREVVVIVDNKWKSTDSKQKYMVSCTDVNNEQEPMLFEITNNLLAWKWNPSDIYDQIEPGKIYKMEIGGSRVPVLSWYPIVYKVEEIEYNGTNSVGEVESETNISKL